MERNQDGSKQNSLKYEVQNEVFWWGESRNCLFQPPFTWCLHYAIFTCDLDYNLIELFCNWPIKCNLKRLHWCSWRQDSDSHCLFFLFSCPSVCLSSSWEVWSTPWWASKRNTKWELKEEWREQGKSKRKSKKHFFFFFYRSASSSSPSILQLPSVIHPHRTSGGNDSDEYLRTLGEAICGVRLLTQSRHVRRRGLEYGRIPGGWKWDADRQDASLLQWYLCCLYSTVTFLKGCERSGLFLVAQFLTVNPNTCVLTRS